MDFPTLHDGMFPHIDNVDVYKYRNELDYSRFDTDQAHITVCHVQWDVGLVHVGDRIIDGLGNVVKFAGETERNAYISGLEDKYEFDTKYRRYHLELEIKLPLPVDRCAEYNYIYVHHEPIPDASDPVRYESVADGVKDWFFFIRELKYLAPNTTHAVLMLDVWQTFIYRFGISGVMLERGHYPLALSDTDAYLLDPMGNSTYLLDPDIDAPAGSVSASDDVHVFDDDVLFALFTSFDFAGSYGVKHQSGWNSPSIGIAGKSGYPSQTCIAVETTDAQSLLGYLQEYIPQALGCVQACAFVPRELVEVSGTFVLGTLSVYNLASKKSTIAHELDREDFAYPEQYAELAKLYTAPYAHIVITDGADTITIEPQTVNGNTIEIITDLQLIADALRMRSQTVHVGGSDVTLAFERFDSKTFTASGNVQDLSILRDIPTYSIYIDNAIAYDNKNYWLNEQRKREADTAYSDTLAIADTAKADAYASAATDQANANASAATDQSNANASAATDQTNSNASALADYTNRNSSAYAVKADADDEATTKTNNAALNTTANSLINGYNIAGSSQDCTLANTYGLYALAYDNGYTTDTTNAQVQANIQNAVISGVSDTVSSVATGAVAGSVIPGVGTLAGAVAGLVSAVPNAITTAASTAVGVNLSVTQANLTVGHANNKFSNANLYSVLRTNNQNSVSTDVTNASNSLITDTTANESALIQGNAQRDYACDIDNSQRTYDTETANAAASYGTETSNAAAMYATQTANAQRAYDTVTANADRDYAATVANAQRDKDTAYAAVDADIAQAALEAPYAVCAGSVQGADAETLNYIDIQVRTMQPADIRRIGDEFLRYGYAYHGYVSNPDFAMMPRFSYWQCSEIFISDLSIPDAYADQIRYLLIGGVTVWSDPAYIGNTSIYDNVIGG